MTIPEMIKAIQGEFHLEQDGLAGVQTWSAIYRRLVKQDAAPPTPADVSTVDERSEKNIQTLLPQVRPYARALVQQAAAQGIKVVVTSGSRTYQEQEALYAQGRFKPGPIVTNAQAGYSNHNFGLAFDVTLFEGAKPVYESPTYKAIGAIGKSLGLEWGGDWKTISDEPHFQLRPKWAAGLSEAKFLQALRARKEIGREIFI